ncbi:MAG: hypothetical protein LBV29_09390 [Azoarcus sp.]|jgi:hypothetical protein|nr:hypothetical protein [Azoarcus sp.]
MKTYFIRLGLWAGSFLLALLANLIAFGAALAGSNRAAPVTVANDQALNAALRGRQGSEDETISSRAGKAARRGRWWGCVLCGVLDWFDPGHCERNIEHDEGRPSKK